MMNAEWGKLQFIRVTQNFLLDLVFPIECFSCGLYGSWWCKPCQDRVVLLVERRCLGCNAISQGGQTCFSCLRSGFPLDGYLAAAAYRETQIKAAVTYLKYECVRGFSEPLGAFLAHTVETCDGADYWWYAMPVPLHVRRERMRGFNQSFELATNFQDRTGIALLPGLIRAKATQPQMELSAKERRAQMKEDIFVVTNPEIIAGKNIFLIDDVATTGSTLEACARVLKKAGALRVWGLTVAHGE